MKSTYRVRNKTWGVDEGRARFSQSVPAFIESMLEAALEELSTTGIANALAFSRLQKSAG